MRRTEYSSELTQDVTFAVPAAAAASRLHDRRAADAGARHRRDRARSSAPCTPSCCGRCRSPTRSGSSRSTSSSAGSRGSVSAGNYVDGVEPATSFSHDHRDPVFELQSRRQRPTPSASSARATTAGFFDVFGDAAGARPRVHASSEDQPGREQVVVLSHRLWTRRFGGGSGDRRPRDPPGRTAVRSHRRDAGVVRLHGADRGAVGADRVHRRAQGACTTSTTLSGLRPAEARRAGRAGASPSCTRIAEASARRFPKDDAELSFAVAPVMEELVGDYRQRLFILLGAVGFVLLIACGNIANLLLARGAARAGRAGDSRRARRRPRPDRPPAADREPGARAVAAARRARARGLGHPRARRGGAAGRAASRAGRARSGRAGVHAAALR